MTAEDKEFLSRITSFAEDAIGEVDPQKVRISEQIEKLRPILQQLALEHQKPIEEIFIRYMDLATEAAVERNNKFNDDYRDIMGDTPRPKV